MAPRNRVFLFSVVGARFETGIGIIIATFVTVNGGLVVIAVGTEVLTSRWAHF